jgi:hypothetical protein
MNLFLFTSTVMFDLPDAGEMTKNVFSWAFGFLGLFLRLFWEFLKSAPWWIWVILIFFLLIKIILRRKIK